MTHRGAGSAAQAADCLPGIPQAPGLHVVSRVHLCVVLLALGRWREEDQTFTVLGYTVRPDWMMGPLCFQKETMRKRKKKREAWRIWGTESTSIYLERIIHCSKRSAGS